MSRNRLAVLPGLTHYEIFADAAMPNAALPFLDGTDNAKSWADQLDQKN
jgi:hypothetical protein